MRTARDQALQLPQAVGQCGRAWLQNVAGFDLVKLTVAHRRNRIPACASEQFLGAESFAAPGSDDQFRCSAHDLLWVGDDAFSRIWLRGLIGEAVLAAGNTNQLRNPLNAADQRIVPFFKVDPWPVRQPCGGFACRLETPLEIGDQAFAARLRTHHRAQHAHEVENLRDTALVEYMYLDAGAYQIGGNIRLQVRKSEYQIRLQRD